MSDYGKSRFWIGVVIMPIGLTALGISWICSFSSVGITVAFTLTLVIAAFVGTYISDRRDRLR